MFQNQTPPQTDVNSISINLPSPGPNHEKEEIQKTFPKRTLMFLSISQIICGCLSVLVQIISLSIWSMHLINAVIGWGIWTGIIFAASGIVGLVGAFKPSKCM